MIEEEALVEPAPGAGPLSTHSTRRPPRASSRATAAPMMPAPTTTASASAAAIGRAWHGRTAATGDTYLEHGRRLQTGQRRARRDEQRRRAGGSGAAGPPTGPARVAPGAGPDVRA